MALLQIRKKANKVFEHVSNGLTFIGSDFEISSINNIIKVVKLSGAPVISKDGFLISEIIVYDDTSGGVAEIFGTIDELFTRLVALGYNPFNGDGEVIEIVEKDGNTEYVFRANTTENVEPTSLEIPNPINGDYVEINLNSGKIERWSRVSDAWVKRYATGFINSDGSGVGFVNNIPLQSGAVSYPIGGYLRSGDSVSTGAIKISLPLAVSDVLADDMISFQVNIFNNVDNSSVVMHIHGHNYDAFIQDAVWIKGSAQTIASSSGKQYNVRFGDDGVRKCIWIGEVDSQWSFPQVQVMNVSGGFNTDINQYKSDWIVTDQNIAFGTIELTVNSGLDAKTLNGVSWGNVNTDISTSGNIISTGFINPSSFVGPNILGDIISLYQNRLGATNMYGFGVGLNVLYYKSVISHDFYAGKIPDGSPNGAINAGSVVTSGSVTGTKFISTNDITTSTVAFNPGTTTGGNLSYTLKNNTLIIRGEFTADANGFLVVATLPIGARPSVQRRIKILKNAALDYTSGLFQTDGDIVLTIVSGTSYGIDEEITLDLT